MSIFDEFERISEAEALGDKIEKMYSHYGDTISITDRRYYSTGYVFKVKLKKSTRVHDLYAHSIDVQTRLKLQVFRVVSQKCNIYIHASDKEAVFEHLPILLKSKKYRIASEKMELPYAVGFNIYGMLVVKDLAQLNHLLLGGSSNSGKSVGLQAMVSSIAYSKAPSEVEMVLIDVGGIDLDPFDTLPHLACPIIKKRSDALCVISEIHAEMEKRINLKREDPVGFESLPRLVLVIDEFPALFNGFSDKNAIRSIVDLISGLLQRGRHAKIHLVFAAQNPTYKNMKVDLGNITARIAFRCAKQNYSETIIGEGGAEQLLGQGDMLLLSPQCGDFERLQGTFITEDELHRMIKKIKDNRINACSEREFNIIIPDDQMTSNTLQLQEHCDSLQRTTIPIKQVQTEADMLLACAIDWALGNEYISINKLKVNLALGWNKASDLVKRLEELGIVAKAEGKSQRRVIPYSLEHLSDEVLDFMKQNGYSENALIGAIESRE